MTWTRLDDSWTDKPEFDELDYAARWHYLAMIQFCCRNDRNDGTMRASDARRASDHPDPKRALAEIERAGLIRIIPTGYELTEIDSHVPPPWVAAKRDRDRDRKRRERAHKAGDHSQCDPERCPHVAPNVATTVTPKVTANAGSGRVGSGRADIATDENDGSSWETVQPGTVLPFHSKEIA